MLSFVSLVLGLVEAIYIVDLKRVKPDTKGDSKCDCKGQEVVQDDFGSCFMMLRLPWCSPQACCRGFTEMQFLQRT